MSAQKNSNNLLSTVLLIAIIVTIAVGSSYITSLYQKLQPLPTATVTTTVGQFEVTKTIQVPVIVTSFVSQVSTSDTSSFFSSSSSSISSSTLTSQSSITTSTSPPGPLNIVVKEIILDTIEYFQTNGYVYWIMTLTVSDSGTQQYEVNPYSFELTSSGHVVYSATYASADNNSLNSVTLQPGGHTTGQIAFKLPVGESPVQLTYLYAFGFASYVVTNFPAPAGVASYVQGNVVKKINGTYSSDLGAYATIVNSSSYFYTGDVIAVKIALNNYYSGFGTNLTVTTITDSDTGFTTIGVSQNLPITIGKSEVDVVLYLKAPPIAFKGQLMNITITTSS